MTDVVDIHDKESVEDGQVVRRRTIITLGCVSTSATPSLCDVDFRISGFRTPDFLAASDFRSSELKSVASSGSINVILKTNSHPDVTVIHPESDVKKASARPSSFNARMTIQQRRNAKNLPVASASVSLPPPSIPTTPSPPPEAPEGPEEPRSTYLYGECGSPAVSSLFSSGRTLSISMSFDDMDIPDADADAIKKIARKSEAWYERRQSYGFEAADKLQGFLNISTGSGSGSRSCDSISPSVRSTSSQIEKMIPPWIRIPNSPVESQPEEEKQFQIPDEEQKSSSRSASDLLLADEKEPEWLRNLKVRRSLRESRRMRAEEPNKTEDPAWINVKLRPTGLKLVDEPEEEFPSGSPSEIPDRVVTESFSSAQDDPVILPASGLRLPSAPSDPASSFRPPTGKSDPPTSSFRVSSSKSDSSVPVSGLRISSAKFVPAASSGRFVASGIQTDVLHHHKSVQLMKMLDDTSSFRADETASLADAVSVDSVGSLDDLGRKRKKVVFDKDTKEESDRKSRPRRIRSRSPETRLREWKSKLDSKSGNVEVPPEEKNASGLPVTRFGDPPLSLPDAEFRNHQVETSEIFRYLLQTRKPSAPDVVPTPEVSPEAEVAPKPIVNGIINFDYSTQRKIEILESEYPAHPPKSILKKRSVENLLDDPASAPEVSDVPDVRIPAVPDVRIPAGINVTISNPSASVLPWKIQLKPVDSGIKIKPPEAPEEPDVPWKAELKKSFAAEEIVKPVFSGITITPEAPEAYIPWIAEVVQKRSSMTEEISKSIVSEVKIKIAEALEAPWKAELVRKKFRSTEDMAEPEAPEEDVPWKAEVVPKKSLSPEEILKPVASGTKIKLPEAPEVDVTWKTEPVQKKSAEKIVLIRNLCNPVRVIPSSSGGGSHPISSGGSHPATKLIQEKSVKGDLGYHSLEVETSTLSGSIQSSGSIQQSGSELSEAETNAMRRSIDETMAFLNQTIDEICLADADLYSPESSSPEPEADVTEVEPEASVEELVSKFEQTSTCSCAGSRKQVQVSESSSIRTFRVVETSGQTSTTKTVNYSFNLIG